jgi:hypothetical protein
MFFSICYNVLGIGPETTVGPTPDSLAAEAHAGPAQVHSSTEPEHEVRLVRHGILPNPWVRFRIWNSAEPRVLLLSTGTSPTFKVRLPYKKVNDLYEEGTSSIMASIYDRRPRSLRPRVPDAYKAH